MTLACRLVITVGLLVASPVAWAAGKTPRVLRSADEVKKAAATGEVTIAKTATVVNCPVLGFGQKRVAGYSAGHVIHYYDLGPVKVAPGNAVIPLYAVTNGVGGQSCVNDYLTGAGTVFTATVLEDPGYVYACAQSGARADTMNVIVDQIAANAPDPYYLTFPVMGTQPILDLGGNQQAVPIIGFTVLRVLGAWFGQEAKLHCAFPPDVKNSSLFCIQTQWDGGQIISGGLPGSGLDLGTRSFRLVG